MSPLSLFQTLAVRLLALCVLALVAVVVMAVVVPSALILILLATGAALGLGVLAVLFGKGTITIKRA
ncbi:hypothetical protein [Novispirillum itersonii]|uniref:Transmembrane protein n=1 Tax=Novispirillum itersonii TaxID=189 RepID=A0A7W9ZFI1_NOVIT|nr:hypothetical protein [Novispirillum itersonii]MBB6210475.1 hypothetical protein [Novispirillum itersonii]